MYSQNEARGYAIAECAVKKIDIDIYPVGKGFNVKQTSLRNSNKFVERVSHEKGKIIVRDAKGKTIQAIDTRPEKLADTKKKEPAKTEEQE